MPNSHRRPRIVLMRAVRLATHCEHPVQRDERLLIFALHRDGVNAGAAIGFEKRLAVGAVGLAPATVRPHVMRRQQNHVEAAAEEKPPPEVRARAGLHDDAARRNGAPEPLELRAGKPLPLPDGAGSSDDRQLEHVLGQVNRNRYRGHGWAPFVRALWLLAIPKYSDGRSPFHSMKLTVACGARSLSAWRYAHVIQSSVATLPPQQGGTS
jgi:hypothetical protein